MKRQFLFSMLCMFLISVQAQYYSFYDETTDKYGFKDDKTGEIIIEPKYDKAEDFSEGLAAVKINGKYGFINKDEKIIISAKYQAAKKFRED
ncbi:MAG: WG repeat-containing protein [Chitinophagales bacterium]